MDSEQMRKREIVADYLRRPSEPESLALETMLAAAGESLLQADYDTSTLLLKDITAVLDIYPQLGLRAFAASPLAADYLKLVQAALAAGYQPQRIHLEGNTAQVWVSTSGLQLSELSFIREQENWMMSGLSSNYFLGPDDRTAGGLSLTAMGNSTAPR